ncbi:hypothetical protein NL108_012534 [Boleophthalmus pectinirostris]|nr:hypothetical protein NL108_012534 [Boleophthalmus pectinirostris]
MENALNRLYLILLNVWGWGRVLIGLGVHERIYVDWKKTHTSAATGFFVILVCRYATDTSTIQTFSVVIPMIIVQQLENSLITLYICQLRRRREACRRREEEDKLSQRLLYLSPLPHPAHKSKETWMKVHSQDWWSRIVWITLEWHNEHVLNDRNYFYEE